MNKKCLIIINGYKPADGVIFQVNRLVEELQKFSVNVDVRKNTEILAYVEESEIISSLPKYDFVIYLDKDRYVAEMLERLGYKVYNSSRAISLCDDKMLTHITLSDRGIKMPTTISSSLCFTDNGNREYLKDISKKLGFPLIIKENHGSLGKQVYLINNEKELIDKENELIHTPHLFQKFIESSRGIDFRIIVINHKVVAYMKRENKHSYLSNLASGGTASKVSLPKEFLDLAIKASKILKLDYCGVDILLGQNGEPILSEVNSNAFFKGIEETTGVNVAKAYVEYLVK